MRNPLLLIPAIATLACVPALHAADDDFQLEDGFTLLFNGQDLTGWKVRGGESLAGKTEAPKSRFRVAEGRLIIDGKVKGNMVIDSEREFEGDAHVKFEYKPGDGCNNDLYFRGVKFDIKPGGVKNLKPGEWNLLEIVVSGDSVEIKSDGEVQRTAKASAAATPLGIRAEFGDIEFRRLRVSR